MISAEMARAIEVERAVWIAVWIAVDSLGMIPCNASLAWRSARLKAVQAHSPRELGALGLLHAAECVPTPWRASVRVRRHACGLASE